MALDEPDDNDEPPEFEYDNSKSLILNHQSDEAEETDFNVQELFEAVTDLVQAESPWSKLITREKLLTDNSLYSEPKLYADLCEILPTVFCSSWTPKFKPTAVKVPLQKHPEQLKLFQGFTFLYARRSPAKEDPTVCVVYGVFLFFVTTNSSLVSVIFCFKCRM